MYGISKLALVFYVPYALHQHVAATETALKELKQGVEDVKKEQEMLRTVLSRAFKLEGLGDKEADASDKMS